jgi:hypothetical protein
MRASAHDAPPAEEQDEGWDETVLVWNATVARIPPPPGRPASASKIAGAPIGADDQIQRP